MAQADGQRLGGASPFDTVEVFEGMRRVWFSLPESTRRAVMRGEDPLKHLAC